MIKSWRFKKLLDSAASQEHHAYFTIDKCHLTEQWSNFRPSFVEIVQLQNQLPSKVIWLALSATVAKGKQLTSLCTNLGFQEPPKCNLLHLLVNR